MLRSGHTSTASRRGWLAARTTGTTAVATRIARKRARARYLQNPPVALLFQLPQMIEHRCRGHLHARPFGALLETIPHVIHHLSADQRLGSRRGGAFKHKQLDGWLGHVQAQHQSTNSSMAGAAASRGRFEHAMRKWPEMASGVRPIQCKPTRVSFHHMQTHLNCRLILRSPGVPDDLPASLPSPEPLASPAGIVSSGARPEAPVGARRFKTQKER